MSALTRETGQVAELVDKVVMAATDCVNSTLSMTLAIQRCAEFAEPTPHRALKELIKEVNTVALNLAIDAVKVNEGATKLAGLVRKLGVLARMPT